MLQEYFSRISNELAQKSKDLGIAFATHKPSLGQNREDLVGKFLGEYLPGAHKISTGLILAKSGEFSRQADLVIVDHLSNAALHGDSPNAVWLVESVYALIEVKTLLSPSTLEDAVQKCRRFKNLPRDWDETFGRQRIFDSLFVLWAFQAPDPETVKRNLIGALHGIPSNEHPDFVVVPESLVAVGGSYRRLSILGQEGSPKHALLMRQMGGYQEILMAGSPRVSVLDSNALLAWLIFVNSWLTAAGPRRAKLVSYVPPDYLWGNEL